MNISNALASRDTSQPNVNIETFRSILTEPSQKLNTRSPMLSAINTTNSLNILTSVVIIGLTAFLGRRAVLEMKKFATAMPRLSAVTHNAAPSYKTTLLRLENAGNQERTHISGGDLKLLNELGDTARRTFNGFNEEERKQLGKLANRLGKLWWEIFNMFGIK